jgi:hypothetical protein
MAYAASVQKDGYVVVGTWAGGDTLPSPPVESPTFYFELTQTEFETVSANPLFWGGDGYRPRWKIVDDELTEQPDTRRLVVFNPSTIVETYQASTTIPVSVEVRQPTPNEHLVDTNINGDFNVQVQAQGPGVSNLWVQVSITAGEGTILIDKAIVKEARISDQGVFRVDSPLQVRILAPGRF